MLQKHGAKILWEETDPQGSSSQVKGILALRHWRVIADSVVGQTETRDACGNEEIGVDKLIKSFALVEENEPNPLMFLTRWCERTRAHECYPLWHDEKDVESKAFFENLPLSKSADDQYVRFHLGRNSKRRRKEHPYAVDDRGRLTLRGRLVSDGG